MTALLALRGVSAGYGPVRVLDRIDLEVAAGGITALLGPNGAGKTTTLRAISGLIRPEGSIAFGGMTLAGRSPEAIARLGIAHVPEGRGTFRRLSVEENLRAGAIGATGRGEGEADLGRIFALFPRLAERRRQTAGTLSGGEQQMLAIGRALMLRPRLMLLDEPSFGLMPTMVAEVYAVLQRLRRDDGLGILLVEQNAATALAIADQAVVIESGRIAAAGEAAALAAGDGLWRAYLGG